MRRLTPILLASALAVVLACSVSAPATTPNPMVFCAYSEPFPAAHLLDRPAAVEGTDAAAASLRRVLRHDRSPLVGGHYPRTGWLAFSQTARSLVVGRPWSTPVPGKLTYYWYLSVDLEHGRWKWSGEGDCFPRRIIPDVPKGLAVTSVRVPEAVRPESHSLKVAMDLGSCGGTARDQFDHVDLRWTATRATLVGYYRPMTFKPRTPNAICAGVGITEFRTIPLPGRLGHRRIFDGTTFPARVIRPGAWE